MKLPVIDSPVLLLRCCVAFDSARVIRLRARSYIASVSFTALRRDGLRAMVNASDDLSLVVVIHLDQSAKVEIGVLWCNTS